MKRSPVLQIAHNALRHHDMSKIYSLLDAVNLSLQEKEVIIKSELEGRLLEEICCNFEHWTKKSVISYPQLYHIKKKGMIKISKYLQNHPNNNKMIIK